MIAGVAMDFDGVHTDNTVQVDQNGIESVRCDRGDGLGVEMLRKRGLPMCVISREQNPVVLARCAKLQIECWHGVDDKLPLLRQWCEANGLDINQVAYIGNDANDVECLRAAGVGIAPADAHRTAREAATLVLKSSGGRGAVRDVCDAILAGVL
jgi:YrbI family 3-deoxy-D-manno-octulosonate 8-phosphate phosphatase